MTAEIKFCGFTRPEDVAAAVAAGARYIGLNFYAPSPRSVPPGAAEALRAAVPAGVSTVALVVEADDAALTRIVGEAAPDMLQLHGRESPARVRAIRTRFGLPVMKAVSVADASDLEKIETYGAVADRLLVDAKPPSGAALPGGNGVPFDWALISGMCWPVPWMLAGGLTVENVADAVRLTGAPVVDLASGVETAPGVKDARLMQEFAAALRRD
ncbi:MAG: phosphoribosylanthranilate isomerase [Pseudomonadota bacterium]